MQKGLGKMNQLTMPSEFLQSIPTSRPDLILQSECYSLATLLFGCIRRYIQKCCTGEVACQKPYLYSFILKSFCRRTIGLKIKCRESAPYSMIPAAGLCTLFAQLLEKSTLSDILVQVPSISSQVSWTQKVVD